MIWGGRNVRPKWVKRGAKSVISTTLPWRSVTVERRTAVLSR